MFDLTSFQTLSENLHPITLYIVPGLIILWTRSRFLTGRLASHSSSLLFYFTITFIYNAITHPLIPYIQNCLPDWLIWAILLIGLPFILGVLLGIETQKDWFFNLFRKCKLNVAHPIETAWDWKTTDLDEQWIIVTLKNGKRFKVWCNDNSFWSTNPNERDLYLDGKFYIDENGKGEWKKLKEKRGILFSAEQISHIEFFGSPPDKGDVSNESNQSQAPSTKQ